MLTREIWYTLLLSISENFRDITAKPIISRLRVISIKLEICCFN